MTSLFCRAAIIGFFTSLDILANMVSIGTLFAFFMVAAALFFYRLYDEKVSTRKEGIIALTHLLLIGAACLGARATKSLLHACITRCHYVS